MRNFHQKRLNYHSFFCRLIKIIYFLLFLVTQPDGSIKIVNKVVLPSSPITTSTKTTLTSLLTGNNANNGNKTFIGTRRIFMTKGADGTTRMITGPANILPKSSTAQSSQQSLIKLQTPPGQQLQTLQLQQSPNPGQGNNRILTF